MTENGIPQTTYELAIIPAKEPKQQRKSDSLACLEWIVGELLKQTCSTPYEEKSPHICIYGDYYFPLEQGNCEQGWFSLLLFL